MYVCVSNKCCCWWLHHDVERPLFATETLDCRHQDGSFMILFESRLTGARCSFVAPPRCGATAVRCGNEEKVLVGYIMVCMTSRYCIALAWLDSRLLLVVLLY